MSIIDNPDKKKDIIFGIEELLKRYENSPEVDHELGIMINFGKKLSTTTGEPALEKILILERRYESLRKVYESYCDVHYRFPKQNC